MVHEGTAASDGLTWMTRAVLQILMKRKLAGRHAGRARKAPTAKSIVETW
jgi:hypothetical protein